jgi:hypothetical protein
MVLAPAIVAEPGEITSFLLGACGGLVSATAIVAQPAEMNSAMAEAE